MSWDLWCDVMKQSVKGRLTLNNIIYDYVANSNIRKAKFEEFRNLIKKQMSIIISKNGLTEESSKIAATDSDTTIGNQISEHVSLTVMETVRQSNQHLLLRQGSHVKSKYEKCSRVMAADVYLHYHLNTVDFGIADEGYPEDEQIEDICAIKDLSPYIKESELKSRTDNVWVTQTDYLKNVIKNSPQSRSEIANNIRNILGMLHITNNIYLIELRYPLNHIAQSDLHAPTFLDGCPSNIYRSDRNSKDGWGRAVELGTCLSGGPEAVHNKITYNSEIDVFALGRVSLNDLTDDEQDNLCNQAAHSSHFGSWYEKWDSLYE